MPRDTGNQLVEYAREQVGDALRTVAVLYEDDADVVYLREGLGETYTAEEYEQVAVSFRTDLNVVPHDTDGTPYDTDALPIGSKRAVVHCHDGAFVFQFPHAECHSILLSVDPVIGTQLGSFIDGCQQLL